MITRFAKIITAKVNEYIHLRRRLGHSFGSQAATLIGLVRFIDRTHKVGPLTNELVLEFILSCNVTPNVKAWRHGIIRRFAEYFSIFDPRTETIDARVLPRSRAIPPVRILDRDELAELLHAARNSWHHHPIQGLTLFTLIGLLASTGLRSGEALRLDRSDVDIENGVLLIRKTKFRKDRLVPVHATTREVLRVYAVARDARFQSPRSPAFFVSIRATRFGAAGFSAAFRKVRDQVGLDRGLPRGLRPHDLRHRFATVRIAAWHRDGVDVQARLPVLATYLGHARYSDTAYYVTGTPELLQAAAERAFGREVVGQ